MEPKAPLTGGGEAPTERSGFFTLRRHEGYDHGYYFIATFIGNHVAFHARALG